MLPDFSIYFPESVRIDELLEKLTCSLDLSIERSIEDSPFYFEGRCQFGKEKVILEAPKNSLDSIEEIFFWPGISDNLRESLLACSSEISISFKGISLAKKVILMIYFFTGSTSIACLFENGNGALLSLDYVGKKILEDDNWHWESEI